MSCGAEKTSRFGFKFKISQTKKLLFQELWVQEIHIPLKFTRTFPILYYKNTEMGNKTLPPRRLTIKDSFSSQQH